MNAVSSPTQRKLTIDDVHAAAKTAFQLGIADVTQLSGGSFGSVWRGSLADGRCVVLKVGPDPHAKLLTYETGMLAEEANYLRLAGPVAGVPTAELLYVDTDYLFMTWLPGTPLSEVSDPAEESRVREESGVAIARLHAVTSDYFGYAGDRPSAATWPDAFTAMIDAILDDAVTWGVRLPVPAAAVRSCVAAQRALLSTVTTASLVHFDLWDGNVLCHDGHLTGLVDGERYLFGDPLVDFASPALFRDILDDSDHPFVRGYNQVRPLRIDEAVRRRLWLCQLYLYLVMIVEYPSRGMSPEADPGRIELLFKLVQDRIRWLG